MTAAGHRFDDNVWTAFEPAERDHRVSALHECPNVGDIASKNQPVSDAQFAGQPFQLLPQWTITANQRDKWHVISNVGQSENEILYVLAGVEPACEKYDLLSIPASD